MYCQLVNIATRYRLIALLRLNQNNPYKGHNRRENSYQRHSVHSAMLAQNRSTRHPWIFTVAYIMKSTEVQTLGVMAAVYALRMTLC